jgi:hypothetical protein
MGELVVRGGLGRWPAAALSRPLHAPGAFGRQAIAGAYGAYVVHPLFISLWAWAFLHVPFATLAGTAIAISPLVVASSWGLTALVRLVPITRRVLG